MPLLEGIQLLAPADIAAAVVDLIEDDGPVGRLHRDEPRHRRGVPDVDLSGRSLVSPRRPAALVAVLLALAVLASACGTRRTHDELLMADVEVSGEQLTGHGPPTPGAADPVSGGGTAGAATGSTTTSVAGSAPTGVGGRSGPCGPAGRRHERTGPRRPGLPRSDRSRGHVVRRGGEAFATMVDGVRVWVRWINDHGGLSGHRVELAVADDGGDPSRHLAFVKEFVEQRKVIAFVANPEALTGPGSVSYLAGQGVPVIGSEGAGDWFYSSPNYFPPASHGRTLLRAGSAIVADYMKQKGLHRVGVIACSEVQTCRDSYGQAPTAYTDFGIDVTYRAQVSLVQPDFTAECLNAKNAGAEALLIGLPANAIRSIARSCARQGYHPIYLVTSGAVVDEHRTDPNLDGMFVASMVAPWVLSSTPLMKEFHAAMTTYAPTNPQGRGRSSRGRRPRSSSSVGATFGLRRRATTCSSHSNDSTETCCRTSRAHCGSARASRRGEWRASSG